MRPRDRAGAVIVIAAGVTLEAGTLTSSVLVLYVAAAPVRRDFRTTRHRRCEVATNEES